MATKVVWQHQPQYVNCAGGGIDASRRTGYRSYFTPQTAVELTGGIIDNSEQRILQLSPLPFPLALTTAFSAKESVYKTFSAQASELPGFASAKIVALTATHLTVQITPSFSQNLAGQEVNVRWFQHDENIITLCEATL